MKTIKPQRIALLYRPYEYLGRFHLTVTAVLFIPFAQPRYLLPEIAMWKFVAGELGKDAVLDMGMPKPRAEVLVSGSCYAGREAPVGSASVRLVVGDARRHLVDKTLRVFGRREWRHDRAGWQASPPEPFVSMPVDYAHAFGGPDFPANPLGIGALPADAGGRRPLPNIEDPAQPLLAPDDRPAPAGFAPIDFTWPQRAAKAGTYDETWLKERFPALADDMDWGLYSAAPADQQLPGFFAGNEHFQVHGMHPERAVVAGALPELVLRCLINQRTAEGLQLREVAMRPETLWLFPHAERAVLIHRGVAEIASDDADDIAQLLIAAEPPGEPRAFEYYRQVLERRLDPQEGALRALCDEELLPPQPARTAPLPEDDDAENALFMPRGLQRKRLARKGEKEFAKAKAKAAEVFAETNSRIGEVNARLAGRLEQAGKPLPGNAPPPAVPAIDPAGLLAMALPADPQPPTLEELPAFKRQVLAEAKQLLAEGQAKVAAAEQQVRAAAARTQQRLGAARDQALQAGIKAEQLATLPAGLPDHDKVMAEARRNAGGPPKPFARATIERLRAAQAQAQDGMARGHQALARAGTTAPTPAAPTAAAAAAIGDELSAQLPQLERQMLEAENQLLQNYRSNAHFMPAAMPMEPAASAAARARVAAARAAGSSLAGVDLTGADLSGLDLRGVDLADALLEGVDFSGADLSVANLAGAVLARARFHRTKLVGARLAGANLGFADFAGADASGADARGAILANACLSGANFSAARLDKADLLGARLAGANLSRVSAPEAKFMYADLSPQPPPAIDFEPPPAPEYDLSGVNFAGAKLDKALFMNARLDAADFSSARLGGAVLLAAKGRNCRFAKAEMTNVRLVGECSFPDADFSGARLDAANLRGSNLVNGNFSACSLLAADFSECRLSGAKFGPVRARGARFAKADLSHAEMGGIDLMEGVLQKATLHGTRLRGANLFAADLLRIRTDAGTDLEGARLQRTLAGVREKK